MTDLPSVDELLSRRYTPRELAEAAEALRKKMREAMPRRLDDVPQAHRLIGSRYRGGAHRRVKP